MFVVAIIGAFLTGCSPFAFNVKGYSYKEEDLFSAWRKVSSHRYIYDPIEYWSSPAEFEAKGGGDCEDFAFAMVYELGREARAVCIRKPDGQFHEIVEYRDHFLEPQRFGMYYEKKDLTILWVANYDETMSLSTLWGIKSPEPTSSRERDSCVESFSLCYPGGDGI